MEFIDGLKFERVDGVLDSKERVQKTREDLEKSTEEAFRNLDNAKMTSWENAHNICNRSAPPAVMIFLLAFIRQITYLWAYGNDVCSQRPCR